MYGLDTAALEVCEHLAASSDSQEKRQIYEESRRKFLFELARYEQLEKDLGTNATFIGKVIDKLTKKDILSTTESALLRKTFHELEDSFRTSADWHLQYCKFLYNKKERQWTEEVLKFCACHPYEEISWIRGRLLEIIDTSKQCLSKEILRQYVEAFAEPAQGMQLALPPLQTALFTLSCRLGEVCIAHLLSRPVRKRLASEIADLLSQTLNDAINSGKSVQRTWIHLLFDCRVLIAMYPDEKLKKLIPTIESHIDPFDLSVLAPHLATNVRLAVSRSQLLYSCLLLETVSAKEGQGSPHYSQVVDVLPKVDYPPRIPLIPRLERTTGETVAKRVEAAKAPRNKLLANTNTADFAS